MAARRTRRQRLRLTRFLTAEVARGNLTRHLRDVVTVRESVRGRGKGYDMGHDDDAVVLHPVEQTEEAFGVLRAFEDERLETRLHEMGRAVREIAPGCVGLSLSLVESDLTFTLVADSASVSLLDAVQYLDGGPCVKSVETAEVLTGELHCSGEPTDEVLWQMFGQAAAHAGIASTLSLPVVEAGAVVAGVNLYGEDARSFDGRHRQLAAACGARSRDVVTNSDLAFMSRVRAAAAPGRLLQRQELDMAVGIVAVAQDIEPREAVARIADAAIRAGVSDVEFARFLLDAHDTEYARREP